MQTITIQWGIWKMGYIDTNGDYQPSALMQICKTEEHAEDVLEKHYNTTDYFIDIY